MKEPRPICSLSLDLDNQWSYMKTHGDPGWESFPSYLDLVVPRFLKVLDDFGWTITVFIVGQDAVLEKNRGALEMIAAAGHGIGNHSFNHEPWLHLYSADQIEEEISSAHRAIESVCGVSPLGFRGPGYSMSTDTLRAVSRSGYSFDASTFPTFIGPLARAYYFLASDIPPDERQKRSALFGNFRDGLRPNRPYHWIVDGSPLLEIPVTTTPVVKLPFHFSYLLYLSTFSKAAALLYLRASLAACRLTNTAPSLLLHPLDFLGGDEVPVLSFFPAMRVKGVDKLRTLKAMFRIISERYTVLTLEAHALRISQADTLHSMVPP